MAGTEPELEQRLAELETRLAALRSMHPSSESRPTEASPAVQESREPSPDPPELGKTHDRHSDGPSPACTQPDDRESSAPISGLLYPVFYLLLAAAFAGLTYGLGWLVLTDGGNQLLEDNGAARNSLSLLLVLFPFPWIVITAIAALVCLSVAVAGFVARVKPTTVRTVAKTRSLRVPLTTLFASVPAGVGLAGLAAGWPIFWTAIICFWALPGTIVVWTSMIWSSD